MFGWLGFGAGSHATQRLGSHWEGAQDGEICGKTGKRLDQNRFSVSYEVQIS